jgi:halocyanin-like protein
MSNRTNETVYSRRGLLKAGAGAAAIAATASGTATAQEGEPYGGYLSDANNFDGTTIDATGQDEVTVAVGAGNAGLAFGPAAIQVDPGTTVVWEWTGEGGGHNVVAEDDSFRSGDPVSEAGTTFEQSFDEAGVRQYYCNPHRAAGMRGVVAVGDTAEGDVEEAAGSGGDGGGGGGGGGDGSGTAANDLALQTLAAMLVLGLLSPIVFLLLARRKLGRSGSPPTQ